jgi:carbonyl reductase 1
MPPEKVMVVTGANTGLGFAVVRRLCQHDGEKAVVYLTARDDVRGRAAVTQLEAEGLRPTYYHLDVTTETSVADFASYLCDVMGDIVISNAAARISPERFQALARSDT